MKKRNALITAAVISFFSLGAWAQNSYTSTTTRTTSERDGPIFQADEVSLDLFGSVAVPRDTLYNMSWNRLNDTGRLGAGAGVNYFMTRYIGIGGDAWTENTAQRFIDNTSGSLIIRIPIDAIHIAPYGFGGGGYQFDYDNAAFLHAGAGLDIRLTHNFGLFVDARYIWPRDHADFGLGRAGIRITF